MKACPSMKSRWTVSLVASLAMFGTLLFAYWPSLADLVTKWSEVPEYSHGYLVPLIALVILWARRKKLTRADLAPSVLGVGALVAALAFRHAAAFYYLAWFEQVSLIFAVGGIILLAGGMAAMKWAWPAWLFLFFMIPLPYRLEVALKGPLRDIGTLASTYSLQTLGMSAFADGRVIIVNGARVGVAEACSGLGMLMVFFALATAVAIIVKQPLWRRLLLVASAVPIALISNVARISSVGLLYGLGYPWYADLLHDRAGWLMMVLALILLWIEMAILDRLVIEEREDVSTIVKPFGISRDPRDRNERPRPAFGPR